MFRFIPREKSTIPTAEVSVANRVRLQPVNTNEVTDLLFSTTANHKISVEIPVIVLDLSQGASLLGDAQSLLFQLTVKTQTIALDAQSALTAGAFFTTFSQISTFEPVTHLVIPLVSIIELDYQNQDSFDTSGISPNLLLDITNPRVFGMNYSSRHWREIPQQKEKSSQIIHKNEFKFNTPSQRKKRKKRSAHVSEPSIWDFVYVLLQPPLVFDAIDNLFLPHSLYPYQITGIDFLRNNESALLADDMGTGKTVMTTVALKILMQQGLIKQALILCPPSILYEWKRHLGEWAPELTNCFVRGTQDERRLAWSQSAHVYVTTYDTLRNDMDYGILPSERRNGFDVVALDEAHHIKNSRSGRAKAVKQLKVAQRWALTGTPIQNRLDDLQSIFDFLRPDFLTSYDMYPERVAEKVAPYFLRRRKKDVMPELPPKQKQEFWLELNKAQREAYQQIENEIRTEFQQLGDKVTK